MKTYKNINYILTQNPRLGFPLAYIQIPETHPWYKIDDYNEVPLDVHGGPTFMCDVKENEDMETFHKFTPGKWIGWDYGHAGDWDFHITERDWNKDMENKMWTFEEVEKEIHEAIEQLVDFD